MKYSRLDSVSLTKVFPGGFYTFAVAIRAVEVVPAAIWQADTERPRSNFGL